MKASAALVSSSSDISLKMLTFFRIPTRRLICFAKVFCCRSRATRADDMLVSFFRSMTGASSDLSADIKSAWDAAIGSDGRGRRSPQAATGAAAGAHHEPSSAEQTALRMESTFQQGGQLRFHSYYD